MKGILQKKRTQNALFLFTAFFFLFVSYAEAHVSYVIPKEEIGNFLGYNFSFFYDVFLDPINYLLVGLTFLTVWGVYVLLVKVSPVRQFEKHIVARAHEYDIFIAWIIRLALGIALVGAGVSGMLISPTLPGYEAYHFLELLAGFFILAGFLLFPALCVSLFLYLFALQESLYLLGNLDFFALTLSFFLLANGKPGVDDLLGIPTISIFKKYKALVPVVLRGGIGIAMIYLGFYEKILNPLLSKEVVVRYGLTNVIPVQEAMWVFSAGIMEIAVGHALLLGLRTRFASIVALFVLSLSFFYFNESVFSHVTLFSTLAILFITGGGKWRIDTFLHHKKIA